MTRLSVYRRLNLKFFVIACLLISVTSFIFGAIKSLAESNKDLQNQQDGSVLSKQTSANSDDNSAKSFPNRWITVDEKEFNHIQNIIRSKGGDFNWEIIERRNGLSVIKANELQILDLTRNMHDEFHKCGGFMSHETLDAARLSIDETLQADSSQQLIEYTINNQINVNPMLSETKEAQIRETIIRLSTDFPNRRYNQPSGLDSANWIKNKWTELAAGRSDITVEFFNHPANVSPQPSIILTVQGTAFPDEVVVLGGHQDSINLSGATVNAPGADDDASGIASLTEAIRIIVAKDFHPQRTVKFMAYAAEEIGLVGSNAIAADYKARGVNVVGVLQLDMTNYKSSNSTVDIAIITDLTNAAQNQFLRDLIATYQPTLTVGNSGCGYGCSDHASWNNKGFPASFPFEGISNPTIHTTNDTLAQSGNNADHAVKFTNLALSYLGELAKGTLDSMASTYEADVATRPNGDGSILSDDVVQVRRFLNGTNAINSTTNEFQRADSAPIGTRGDGVLDSTDIVQARRYQNETNPKQTAGGPTAPIGQAVVGNSVFDQLFETPAKTVSESIFNGANRELEVESAMASANQTVTINIRVDAAGDESEYGFVLNYDASVLSNPVLGAGSAGVSVRSCNTATAGQINCSIGGFAANNPNSAEAGIGEIAAGTNQILMTVTFTVAANAATGDTPLTLSNVNASSDATQLFTPKATNGAVTRFPIWRRLRIK